jgi:hypothetical protein
MNIRGLVLRIGLTIALALAISSAANLVVHHEAVAGCDSCR